MDKQTIMSVLLQKKAIVIAGFVLLVLVIVLVILLNFKSIYNPSSPTSVLPTVVPVNNANIKSGIARVGRESISQKDYDYVVANNFAGSTAIEGKTEAEVKKIIKDMLAEESLILQAAEKQGLIRLDGTIYDSPTKDLAKRKETVNNLKTIIESKYGAVTYSRISIWTYNIDPPQMGVEQGRSVAKSKMDALHADLVAKKITMEQAAEAIKGDATLAQIDPVYKKNAFFRNTASLDELPAEIRTALKALEPNQYSPVLALKGDTTDREEYYVILKLEDKKGSGSFDEWMNAAKQQFPAEYY